jgi:hypothetical protein
MIDAVVYFAGPASCSCRIPLNVKSKWSLTTSGACSGDWMLVNLQKQRGVRCAGAMNKVKHSVSWGGALHPAY